MQKFGQKLNTELNCYGVPTRRVEPHFVRVGGIHFTWIVGMCDSYAFGRFLVAFLQTATVPTEILERGKGRCFHFQSELILRKFIESSCFCPFEIQILLLSCRLWCISDSCDLYESFYRKEKRKDGRIKRCHHQCNVKLSNIVQRFGTPALISAGRCRRHQSIENMCCSSHTYICMHVARIEYASIFVLLNATQYYYRLIAVAALNNG